MKLKTNLLSCKVLVLLLLMLSSAQISFAQPEVQLFAEGNKYYMDQSYEKAAESYEKLVAMNKVSPEVYFNLGNAYYKTGNIASAILNYERAKRLKPSDADIQYNLRIANLNTIDKIEPVPQVFYEKWWDRFVNEGSVNFRAMSVILMLWISLGLAAVYLFSKQVVVRKAMFFATISMVVIALFTWYLTYLQNKHLNDHKAAIIFTESAYVKSSPDDKSSNLFMLHSGTRIEVLDTLKGWKKVRIANGNEGWVIDEAIEII